MEDCIFCKIINGEIPSDKVYEDDNTLAFLDTNQNNKGHTLVVPKEHYENIFDIPEDKLSHLIKITKKVAKEINDKYKPDGIIIRQNNGKEAGQSVFHLHIHIIPTYKNL